MADKGTRSKRYSEEVKLQAAKLVVDLSEWVPVYETKEYEIAALATAAAMEACLARVGISVRLDADDLYAQAKEHDRLAADGTYLQPVIFVADFSGVSMFYQVLRQTRRNRTRVRPLMPAGNHICLFSRRSLREFD